MMRSKERARPWGGIGLLLSLQLCISTQIAAGQIARDLPHIEGESFSGEHVVLPEDASGNVAVLVFGFTKASKAPTTVWAKRLSEDFAGNKNVQVYQLPVLEEVPHLIRGMVISAMKKGVPQDRRKHFVPILQHEYDLKKFVQYKEPDDAYIVVLEPSSKTALQIHGATDDPAYAQVRSRVQLLLGEK